MVDDPNPTAPHLTTGITAELLAKLNKAHSEPKTNVVELTLRKRSGNQQAPEKKQLDHYLIGPLTAEGMDAFLAPGQAGRGGVLLSDTDREGIKTHIDDIKERMERYGEAARTVFVLDWNKKVTDILHGKIEGDKDSVPKVKFFGHDVYDPGQFEPYYRFASDRKPITAIKLNPSSHGEQPYGFSSKSASTLFNAMERHKDNRPQDHEIWAVPNSGPLSNTRRHRYFVFDPMPLDQFKKRNMYSLLPANVKDKVDVHLKEMDKDGRGDSYRVVAVTRKEDGPENFNNFMPTRLFFGKIIGKEHQQVELMSTIDCRAADPAVEKCKKLHVPPKLSENKVKEFFHSFPLGWLSLAPQQADPKDPMALALAQARDPAYEPPTPDNYQPAKPGFAKGRTPGTPIISA